MPVCRQVQDYDKRNRSWVYYSSLSTRRFTAQKVNITTTAPTIFGELPMDLPDLGE